MSSWVKILKKIQQFFIELKDYIILFIVFIGISSFLIGLGFRGKYAPASNVSPYISLAGVIILLPFIIVYIVKSTKKELQQKKLIELEERNFKQFLSNSIKTKINLTKNLRVILFDGKAPKELDSFINKQSINSRYLKDVRVEILLPKEKLTYTFQTERSLDEINILFYTKKETILYKNQGSTYIDFDFAK